MENLHQLDQLSMEMYQDYNIESASHLDYHLLQSSRQLESNTSDCGRMPDIPTSLTPLSITTDWTDSYPNSGFDMDLLFNEWSETQTLLGHDWGEMQMSYGETNPVMAQTDLNSPSQPFWPLNSLQIDDRFDSFSSQCFTLPESCYPTQEFSTSWNYPTPIPSTPSSKSDENNYYLKACQTLEASRATGQPLLNAGYICETCSMTYKKLHLLNDHKKIHEKSITCPVQRCPHRTAKSRDMNRHVKAKHLDYVEAQALPTPPRPVCPVPGCKQGRRGFARKDYLRRHLKKAHPDWLSRN